MSRPTDGKIRVAGLREAYQSILTERPKGFSCSYKRLKSFLKTHTKPSQMLVSVGIGGAHLVAVRFPELCLCPGVNPGAGRSSVSVWFHS